MIQTILTYLIVATAIGIVIYKILKNIKNDKNNNCGCNCGCGGKK